MTSPDMLDHIAKAVRDDRKPPVHKWNPDCLGKLDMTIARDGSWHYMGSPIARRRMVKLFASILRRDADGRYYLVTPVERFEITVEDAPFVAVEMFVDGEGVEQRIAFRTQVDDYVVADADHPIRIATDPDSGEPAPYIMVRDGLEALIARAVFYDLVDLATGADGDDDRLGVWSAGRFFELGRAEA
ncbi:DUF1285 domain-containing protein [Oceanibacterium hippocampi]|nr:DUF1285 domain-containing protein [Oceanibacterium hippocampi]